MEDKEIQKLIELERKKIKKHPYLGFNTEMYLNSYLNQLSKSENVIDKNTNEPLTQKKIYKIKSILFGRNPKRFNEIFPKEDYKDLYEYIKSYVKNCEEEERFLESRGNTDLGRMDTDDEQIEKDEKEEKLRQLTLENCKKENGEKFLFTEESGDPPSSLHYFIDENDKESISIKVKTLPPWFDGSETIDFSKSNDELTKPFEYIVGIFRGKNNQVDFQQKLIFNEETIKRLSKSLEEFGFTDLSNCLSNFEIKYIKI
jgi:hypothetical protein